MPCCKTLSVLSLPLVLLRVPPDHRPHEELVDDAADKEEEEHSDGALPAGPVHGVVSVVSDAERGDDHGTWNIKRVLSDEPD